MSLTQERLVDLLDEIGLRHWDAADADLGVVVPFAVESITRPSILVHARVDGDGLIFSAMVTQFMKVPADHPHAELFMQALLHEAYVTALGQWELDPSDGEVRVTVQLPLFGTEPTAKQVARVVGAAAQLAERAWPRLLSILEHGEDPVLEKQGGGLGDDAKARELRRLQLRMQQLISSTRKDPDDKETN